MKVNNYFWEMLWSTADSAEMSVALLGGTTMSTTALENLRERVNNFFVIRRTLYSFDL